MEELHQYIASYFGTKEDDLEALATLFHSQTLSKGDYHTKSGSYKSNLSFIRSGYLRIYAYHEGKEITQWVSSQGEFTTDLANIMFQMPARWNIQAITDCELYSITPDNYQKIGELIPSWCQLEKLFLSKCFLTLENRVFSFLSLTAEKRYQELFHLKKDLFNQIPLNYLASMLGMSPETLSRIRNKQVS